MPSIREVLLEEERTARLERIKLSRRFGSGLGKEAARRYSHQVKCREEAVINDVRSLILQQKKETAAAKALKDAENSLRKGEGIRNAQEYSASLAAKATQEVRAWAAEDKLVSVRHSVALQIKHLENEQRNSLHVNSSMSKSRARAIEDERSERVVSRAKSSVPFTSLAVPIDEERGLVTLAERKVPVADVTARYEEQRRKEIISERESVEEEQRRAFERSKRFLEEKRADDELQRIEKENEEIMKKTMIAHAMRSIRPTSSHDLQEQDERRSTALSQKAHADFENIFLQGPWEADAIKKCQNGGIESNVEVSECDESFALFKKTSVDLLLEGTPSVGLPVESLFAKIVHPTEEVTKEAGDEAPLPNERAPVPTATSELTLSDEPTVIANEFDQSLPTITKTSDQQFSVTPEDNAFMEDRNQQFLQQLALLQRRLEAAKNMTTEKEGNGKAKTDKLNVDKHSPSQNDSSVGSSVSVSPMSSPEKEMPRYNSISGTDAVRDKSNLRFAMTADQLRAAIQRMKLSNKINLQ